MDELISPSAALTTAIGVLRQQIIVSKNDLPKLCSELVGTLDRLSNSDDDYVWVCCVLTTIDSFFIKFRYHLKSNDLLIDFNYCLDNFAKPLFDLFKRTATVIDHLLASGRTGTIKAHVESQRLCCSIFYSLNFMEIPQFFKDHIDEWMVEFQKYLTGNYFDALEDSSSEGLDGLRVAVCENITLYTEKQERLFYSYLGDLVVAVWRLLVVASASSNRDRLTVTGIKFLKTLFKSQHRSLLAQDLKVQQIVHHVVVPNVMLRDEDEDLFKINFVEFIKRDMEGSDLDRRRISCELPKVIATDYKRRVTEKISPEIQNCLALFAANPIANWKYKDCAIYLVVSLATDIAGGSSVLTDLVDVENFFRSVCVPELQSQDVNAFPMLKAAALKFFTMFGNQIPKNLTMSLLPDVIRFLTADSNVVHSYAARCIEKLLLVKDDDGCKARYTSADLGAVLPMLMTNLFSALQKTESEENQYVMKCIMRVLGAADITKDVALPYISGLATILQRVCRNPQNPVFNHYLFESVAVVIRQGQKDPSLLSDFETQLSPILQMVWAQELLEFYPYTFYLLAQLVESNRPPFPQPYMEIFEILLSPDLWKRTSNVPALVRLLQAFWRTSPQELKEQGRLSSVLRIFNTLVSSPSTDEQGLYVLNTLIENLGYDVLSTYVSHIWVSLFQHLKCNPTLKFTTSLLIFMSLFMVKYGCVNLVNSMNAVQPDAFRAILEQFWVPNLKRITGPLEIKLSSVVSTRIICESPALLDSKLWGKMLDSIVTLLSRPEEERVLDEPEVPDFGVTVGYNPTFVYLYNARKKEEDPLKEIMDPKQFLVTSLGNLRAKSLGTYIPVINQNLEPANQHALLQLFRAYNISIVEHFLELWRFCKDHEGDDPASG